MQKRTLTALALVWMLAACAPAAPSTPLAQALPPAASLTQTQSPSPTATALPSATQTPVSSDESVFLASPDGQWTAILNREAGSLEVEDAQGGQHIVFPAGSAVHNASWSLDSSRLVVALNNTPRKVQAPEEIGVAEIWLATVADGGLSEPRRLRAPEPSDEDVDPWITFGAWSPEGSRLLYWLGPLGASIQADGVPLWSLEIENGKVTRLAESALVNPAYQSWAPDGSALAFTDGGYRSAQVNKWLSLYEVASGQVTTLIPENELIPGQVAWSPAGDTIAFTAVEASQTGDEWADWMSWENPAIQARRIYLLDPQAGEYRRLNAAEAYQDAPRWSADGETLYFVQIDGNQAVIMAADPATGEAQPLPSCQEPRPDRAGYYGQVDWAAFYENCPEAEQSSAPSPSNLSSPEQDAQATQIEAIDAIRALFGLPELPLEFIEMTTMINSPNGDLSVALYQDAEGRNYSVEPESNLVVEIDARAAPSSLSSGALPLSQDALRTKAETFIRGAIPDFESKRAGLAYEAGVKEDNYFFTWRAANSSGAINAPFVQIGLYKSGELFAYYNTLTLIEKARATISGQVIAGYGDHRPVADLPLRIRQEDDDGWDAYTDGNGFFTLTNLPAGLIDIDNSHLSFQVTIDAAGGSIDLGKLSYPLIHPFDYYWWRAAPLADLNQLFEEGQPVDFEVCAADASWVRPDNDALHAQVYSQFPFNQVDEKAFEKFNEPAILYDTIDATFTNSFPPGFSYGLNLDELGADWLYLTGLWTADNNPISNSDCSYTPDDLQSLFDRSKLEVWLFGYQATEVQELDKDQAEVAPGSLCDPNERSCAVRPGYHYAVYVLPAPGFQIIRFAGQQDVLTIHILESGIEILALP